MRLTRFAKIRQYSTVICLSTLFVAAGMDRIAVAGLMTHEVNVVLNAGNFDSYTLDLDQNGTGDFQCTAVLARDPGFLVGIDVVDFPFGSNN